MKQMVISVPFRLYLIGREDKIKEKENRNNRKENDYPYVVSYLRRKRK